MTFADLKVTTQVLWQGALIFAVIDILFVVVLAKRIKVERFRLLK